MHWFSYTRTAPRGAGTVLAILKLREDYRRKQGSAFRLQEFHDRFMALGPLPLPLVREALLGERGQLF